MYQQITLAINPIVFRDIVINELSVLGYDSFWEIEEGVKAYIAHNDYDKAALETKLSSLKTYCKVELLSVEALANINWNEEWEKQFEPVIIDNKLLIKAPFHDVDGVFQQVLTIQPKMSFGTGHHATTYLVSERMFDLDLKNKAVLDFGSGTAILSILAEKLGSEQILAIDNDEWSYDNAKENAQLNNCSKIQIELGNNQFFEGQKFDIILANINRGVILATMKQLANSITDDGRILFSGILKEDIPIVNETAVKNGLNLVFQKEKQSDKNTWMLLEYVLVE